MGIGKLRWQKKTRQRPLYGNPFEAWTDNNPLTYVLSSAKLDATGHRWVAQLANYEFTIHYRSGKSNIDANALSRICWPQVISQEVVSAVLKASVNGIPPMENYPVQSVGDSRSPS